MGHRVHLVAGTMSAGRGADRLRRGCVYDEGYVAMRRMRGCALSRRPRRGSACVLVVVRRRASLVHQKPARSVVRGQDRCGNTRCIMPSRALD